MFHRLLRYFQRQLAFAVTEYSPTLIKPLQSPALPLFPPAQPYHLMEVNSLRWHDYRQADITTLYGPGEKKRGR
ncbi:hypothetical protein V8N91_002919 [Enterobacter hormaechei]|nr:hypothetical protein [Enterobacter hormaechei]